MHGVPTERAVQNFYPNMTMLRSGICRRKSICRLSSSVRNVRTPYSAGGKFRQCFYVVLYRNHSLTCVQNYTEIVPEKPLPRRLNASGVAKYNDVGPIYKAISRKRCKIRPRVLLITNTKSYRRIQWYHFGPSKVTTN